MKTQVAKTFGIGAFIVVAIVGCNNSPSTPQTRSNADSLQSDSVRQDVTQVAQDTAGEALYRQDAEARIKENNDKIAVLKEKEKKAENKMGRKYHEDVDKLGRENSKLDSTLRNYSMKGNADWKAFKHDFSRDMDTLGKSISRLAEKINPSKD